MSDDLAASLSARLERIRKENRRLKLVSCWSLLALPIVLLVMGGANDGDPVFEGVEARRFTLRGKDGNVALLLEIDGSGSPAIKMLDRDGHVRIRVVVDAEFGPSQELSGKDEKTGISISTNNPGASSLHFANGDEGLQMALVVAHVGPTDSRLNFGESGFGWRMIVGRVATETDVEFSEISVIDGGDVNRIYVGLSEDEAELTFRDPKENPRMVIKGEKDGEVFVRFRDEQEKPLLILPGGFGAKR